MAEELNESPIDFIKRSLDELLNILEEKRRETIFDSVRLQITRMLERAESWLKVVDGKVFESLTVSGLNEINKNLIEAKSEVGKITKDTPEVDKQLLNKFRTLSDIFSKFNLENVENNEESKILILLQYYSNELEEKQTYLTQLVEKFNNTNDLLEKSFTETTSRLEESNQKTLLKLDKDALEIKENYQKNAREKLADLHDLLEKGKDYNNLLSGKVISDSFAKRASKEKWKALFWTIGTWIFALATLASLGYIFYLQINNLIQDQSVNYSLLTTKVLITATLGFIAKWTSKRANRHLAEESKYHRLSVNSSTIKDYVKDLDEKSRDEVLKAAAIKLFTEVDGNEISTDFETANVLDALKELIPKGK